MKDVKVGVILSAKHAGGADWDSIKGATVECERLGYSTLFMGDHFSMGGSRLECWTVLSALSSVTEKIRLGSFVLANGFRSPSVLAKMAATLDVISGGRLELGIGVGYYGKEFEAYGMTFPKISDRVQRLEEALEIIKRMWTQDKPSFEGRYYRIKEAVCEPKPLQKPHPPIIIGGGEEKHLLKAVAKYADRWNFELPIQLSKYKRRWEIVKDYCSQIGRDPDEIELSCFFNQVIVHPDKKKILESLKKAYEKEGGSYYGRKEGPIPFEVWLEEVMAGGLVGTPEECLGKIRSFTDMGISHFVMKFIDVAERGDSLSLFASEVMRRI